MRQASLSRTMWSVGLLVAGVLLVERVTANKLERTDPRWVGRESARVHRPAAPARSVEGPARLRLADLTGRPFG